MPKTMMARGGHCILTVCVLPPPLAPTDRHAWPERRRQQHTGGAWMRAEVLGQRSWEAAEACSGCATGTFAQCGTRAASRSGRQFAPKQRPSRLPVLCHPVFALSCSHECLVGVCLQGVGSSRPGWPRLAGASASKAVLYRRRSALRRRHPPFRSTIPGPRSALPRVLAAVVHPWSRDRQPGRQCAPPGRSWTNWTLSIPVRQTLASSTNRFPTGAFLCPSSSLPYSPAHV